MASQFSFPTQGAFAGQASIPVAKIQGGTLGRLLYDNGTQGAWLGVGTSGWLLMSTGGGAPAWTNTLSGLLISGASNTLVNIPAATALLGIVPVPNGGTNKATWTSNSVVVATGATALGEVAPGTSGWLLTSQGAGSPPVMAAPAAATVVRSKLSGTYLVASTTYANVGVSVALDAGQWHVVAEIRDLVQGTAGDTYLLHRLYDSTSGAAVADTETVGPLAATTGAPYGGMLTITADITLAAASTIDVQAARSSGTHSIAQVIGDAEGWTRVTAFRRAS